VQLPVDEGVHPTQYPLVPPVQYVVGQLEQLE
jgi:hypothetical protein